MDAAALIKLKAKVADEFWQLLCKVRKGHRVDYDFINDEVTYIELSSNGELDDNLDIAAYQYYLNNSWTQFGY